MTPRARTGQARTFRPRPAPTTRETVAARRLRRHLRHALQRRGRPAFLPDLLTNPLKPEAPVNPNVSHRTQNVRVPRLALALCIDIGPQSGLVWRPYVATDKAGALIPHPAAIGRDVTDKEQKRVLLEVLVGLKALARNAS